MGRKFVRMSLGGIHDEAEIRGHRRTYIGALPGRIIQNVKTAGTNNPVFMLDEIDKIGMDFRGDPSSALLEVLDPEQNNTFQDNYLEVPFDLSKVLFIATGNLIDPIPPALRDRMEIIELPGYTQQEKIEIGKRFLVPKQMKNHGLKPKHIEITDEAMVDARPDLHARGRRAQPGARDRQRHAQGRPAGRRGPQAQDHRRRRRSWPTSSARRASSTASWSPRTRSAPPRGSSSPRSVATSSPSRSPAWRARRTSSSPASWATSCASRHAPGCPGSAPTPRELGIEREVFEKNTLHIHVPAGAIPKDGPSAGITMATAMVSALTGIPVRKDVAMTGEITLRGRVLPIGGLKSKILAAHLSGAKIVILPRKNEKDLRDIPEEIRKQMKLVLVDTMDQVLEAALRRKPQPLVAEPPKIIKGDTPLDPAPRVAGPPVGLPAGRSAAGRRRARLRTMGTAATARCRGAGCARSLAHRKVRALACSPAPCLGLAGAAPRP